MTSPAGVPEVSRFLRHAQALDALRDVITDLHDRADLLSQLLRSARGPQHANGRIYVDLDADAWYAALLADIAPRPQLPQ